MFGAIRKCYSAPVQAFADEDGRTHKIFWYFAPPDAIHYEEPHTFPPRIDFADDPPQGMHELTALRTNQRRYNSGVNRWHTIGDHWHGDAADFLGLSPRAKYSVSGADPVAPCGMLGDVIGQIVFGGKTLRPPGAPEAVGGFMIGGESFSIETVGYVGFGGSTSPPPAPTGPCSCCDGPVPMIGFVVRLEAPDFPLIDGLEYDVWSVGTSEGLCIWSSASDDEETEWLDIQVDSLSPPGTIRLFVGWTEPETGRLFRTDIEIPPSFTCDPWFFDHTLAVFEELGEVDEPTGFTVRVVVIEVMTEAPLTGFTGTIEVLGSEISGILSEGVIEVLGEQIAEQDVDATVEGVIEVLGEQGSNQIFDGEHLGVIEVLGEQAAEQEFDAAVEGVIEVLGEQGSNQIFDGEHLGVIEVLGEQAAEQYVDATVEGVIEVLGEQSSNQIGNGEHLGVIEVLGEQSSNQIGDGEHLGVIEVLGVQLSSQADGVSQAGMIEMFGEQIAP